MQVQDIKTTVVRMEDSGEDSKIYQKFKRLAETKKDEIAYKYNPVRKYDVLKYAKVFQNVMSNKQGIECCKAI